MLSVCIGTAVLGFVHLSLLAHWLGGVAAALVTSSAALVALALVAVFQPAVRPGRRSCRDSTAPLGRCRRATAGIASFE